MAKAVKKDTVPKKTVQKKTDKVSKEEPRGEIKSLFVENRTNQKQVLILDDSQIVLKAYGEAEIKTTKNIAEVKLAQYIQNSIINLKEK